MQLAQCSVFIDRTIHPAPKSFYESKEVIITKTVCEYFGITEQQAFSKSRTRPIIFARQLIQALLYFNCPAMSIHFIGEKFGQWDHTSVLHSTDTVMEKLSSSADDPVKEGYHAVIKQLPFEAKPAKKRYNYYKN